MIVVLVRRESCIQKQAERRMLMSKTDGGCSWEIMRAARQQKPKPKPNSMTMSMITRTLACVSELTRRNRWRGLVSVLCSVLPMIWMTTLAGAADVTYTGGALGSGVTWLTATNWSPTNIPTSTDTAVFNASSTNIENTIQMANNLSVQPVGAIRLEAANTVNRAIRNNSGLSNGVLVIYGVAGSLLRNDSSFRLRLTNGVSTTMGVSLAGSGEIYTANDPSASVPSIEIFSAITNTGGANGFTKNGPGTLYLREVNTFSGPVTNLQGVIKLDSTSTIGNGTGTLYMAGGYLVDAATRASAPVANPVVLLADANIYNDSGTVSERIIPFSGPFSGSAGSLIIGNQSTTVGNINVVRLSGGGYTFSRPINIGSIADTAGAFAMLELGNTGAAGAQTFSGVISGGGILRRGNSSSGISILTGDNTYSGGTIITSGTLFANNSSGSALGSGSVTVTNNGVLGGSGAVVAVTSVSLNGTVSPGVNTNTVGNLGISDLTLGEGANYRFNVTSAAGSPGTAWDVVTVSGTWTDAGSTTNPITIKLDSLGAIPTGWSNSIARDWVIIDGGAAAGFDAAHFVIDTTAFVGAVQGVFALSVVSGDLHLTYTPATDVVINVPAGTQTQGAAGYPFLTGTFNVMKVGNGEVVFTNSANDYAGITKIFAGTASVNVDALNNSGAFGNASSGVLLGNTLGNSNATLNINTPGITVGRAVVVQAGSTGTKTMGTTIPSGTATFSGDVTVQDAVTLTAPAGGTAVFSGDITGTNGVTTTGLGAITLSGANTYSGNTVVSNGTLNLIGKAGTGTLVIAGTSTLDNPSASANTLNNTSNVWNANFTFLGTTNLSFGSGPVTLNGTRVVTVSNNTLTVGGPLGGTGGVTKSGPGTLAMTTASNSTYTGATTLSDGLLTIGSSTTFGDGTGTLNFAGGTLGLTGTRNISNSIIANPINMTADTVIQNTATAAAGTRNFPFGGGVTASGGTLTIRNIATANTNVMHIRLHAGGINFARAVVFDNSTAGSAANNTCQLGFYNTNGTADQIFSGIISGPGSITRSALNDGTGGTTVLSGQNTYQLGTTIVHGYLGLGASSISSGGLVISGPVGTGTLEIDDDTINGFAGVGVFAYGGARTLDNRVWLNGPTNVLIAGSNDLTFAGQFDLGGIAKTLTVSNTALTTISGLMTNTAALTKDGPGTLVLSGYNNFRTNTTTVAEGLLLVDNTVGSGTGLGAVIVNNGGTLGGTGIVAGAVSGDGSIAPGQSAGTLTLEGGLDLSSGGTYVWELAANSTNSPGTNFDVISLTGSNLVLGGTSKLSLSFTGSATTPSATNAFWQSARQWTILALSGAATNIGPTVFPTIINGTNAAGSFTNFADANGNIVLQFTPSSVAPPPQPVLSPVIAGANTASATITWSASNGYTYTVQMKTNLTQATWTTLGTSTASGSTASFIDTTGPRPQSYYRVIWP